MTEKDMKKSQHKLIVISCIAVFVLFLVYTIFWEVDYFSKYGNFKWVKCEVVEHFEEDGKMYDVYVFETDKKEFVKKTTPFESKYDIGETFHVYYDKNSPSEVIYKTNIKKVLLPVITTAFGIATTGIVILYFNTYKKYKVRK